MIHLTSKNSKIDTVIELTRSKSESNRALILKALFSDDLNIHHLSDSDDTKVLAKALLSFSGEREINVGHAGTSFRFLTAFLASQEEGSWLLTGSDRMKDRPIKILVDALRSMGAEISYEENEGYPPLRIEGGKNLKNVVQIDAGVSSQYISALMMIGARIKGGLQIRLEGKITSVPYINMTASLMREVGIPVDFNGGVIRVSETPQLMTNDISIEADWSAASYWYSVVALSSVGSRITLNGLNQKSRQGDAAIVEYFERLGVESVFENNAWVITKRELPSIASLSVDLADTPDVAQTLVCTCAGLGVGCELTGLHTLRIKETDRLAALKIELEKFGIAVEIPSDNELIVEEGQVLRLPTAPVATYKDHRMAMAFAPLAIVQSLSIENEDVVSKSYPNFWEDFRKVLM